MRRALCTTIDRLTIRAAAAALQADPRDCNVSQAAALMADPGFLRFQVDAPADFLQKTHSNFAFTSPLRSPWPENNIVHGKFFPWIPGKTNDPDGAWTTKPSVILLHGWNGERGYHWQFPYLAWRLNRLGLNVAMLELPYHGRRKPASRDAIRNFISHDLLSMVEATRQAVADTRALAAWLANHTSGPIGLWGISLGAWLGGLSICYEDRLDFAVLMSPVASMEQAVRELDFCAPIRTSLAGHEVSLSQFNLVSHKPLIPAENILLIESIYDLFAPSQTVEELWQAWGRTEILRVNHGHISVLASLPVMNRASRWIAAKGSVPAGSG